MNKKIVFFVTLILNCITVHTSEKFTDQSKSSEKLQRNERSLSTLKEPTEQRQLQTKDKTRFNNSIWYLCLLPRSMTNYFYYFKCITNQQPKRQ
jgi:hypothetical protein